MPSQPTLLCIDDEENGLIVRKWLFETEGYQTLTALDGPSGIDLFQRQPVDAVILDYRMPRMDGAVVAEKLKQLRPGVPIVMLSAEHSVPPQAQPHIDAFVRKGEAPGVLLSTTASLLHLRSHAHVELEGKYVAFVDEHRRYLDVTDGVCELLGYSRSELLQMKIDDVTAPAMRSNTAPLFRRYMEDGTQEGEYILLDRNGSEVPIYYIARVFPDGCMVARWEREKIRTERLAG
jgi:PAS domain S-box-containing protein